MNKPTLKNQLYENVNQLAWALMNYELMSWGSFGYITGLERSERCQDRFRAHIYKGKYDDLEKPMCPRGYNREGKSFSIFRNNVGNRGICITCLKNTLVELQK